MENRTIETMAKIRSEVMSRIRSDSMIIGVRYQCRRVGRLEKGEGRSAYKLKERTKRG